MVVKIVRGGGKNSEGLFLEKNYTETDLEHFLLTFSRRIDKINNVARIWE